MTRVQAPDSNAYDVLGVAPGDSAKQIDDAFHQLIEEGGYRAGVPLRGQWLRARQIKEAYATIGDPGKRRAYDESLKEGSERPLWSAVSQNDPTEAAMVRPLSEWQPPPEPAIRPTTKATGSGDRDGERVLAPATAIESDNGEIATYFDESATSPEEDTGPTDVDYGPAKLWGIAGAVTLALGSLFYFTWPSGQLQLPATDMAAQLPEGAPQANAAAARPETLAKLPPALEAEELFGEVRPWGPGDTPPMPAGLSVSSGTAVATETTAPPPAPTELVVATETQTPPDPAAATATATEAASATAPAAPPASEGPTPTLAEAAVPTVAPPPAAPAQVAPPVAVRSTPRAVRSQAQWIAGGPTRSDNPRGRYVGSVIVQFTVQANGRVANCGPARSSGDASLDAFTCRLVEERMRFKPALDAQGGPVASTAHARYEWGRRRRHSSLLSWMLR